MNVDHLVHDIKRVRAGGIAKTKLDVVPALKEALARHWPDIDDADRAYYIKDLLAEAADQLIEHDAEGIRLALGIDKPAASSRDRRSDFAVHNKRDPETVRRRGGLEDQEFTKLAKAILSLPAIASSSAKSGDHRVATKTAGSPRHATGEWLTATAEASHRDKTDNPGPDAGKQGAAADHRSAVEQSFARIPMSTITSKARAYLAIDSFEQDLRQGIELYLLDHLPPEEVFSAEYDELSARQARDDVSETSTLTQYLYPQQAYDVLLRRAAALPADLADILQLNLGALDGFVAVRNRVMHGRPLQPDDLDDTESLIGRFRSRYFPQTEEALTQLDSDSDWQPRARIGSSPPERILHNLPSPDFDETGLLGRERQVKDIVSMVKRRGDRMITLTGEGGIGKTALALEVCYRLVDDPEPPFEAILWTSLKSERLTPAGVQELSNAIRDIGGATNALGQAIDHTFHGSAHQLAEALEGSTTLIVIDNLETAQGNEVVGLYDALPASVTFLFTSRVGVGQIERPVPVGPLEEESAELLFRKFARNRGQSELAELTDAKVGDALRQLRYSPLAIRWYILSVEAGKTPTDTLRNQEELLRFCVKNVIDALNSDERLLLAVLRMLDRPISFDELAVISEIEIDTLRRGAQRLAQGSLLVRSQLANVDDPEALALSSTARAFLPTFTEPEVMEDVLRRETTYNKERERSRIAARGRYLDVNVVFERSDRDAPTAHLLRRALRENKSGYPQAASATMARAREINPDYFEVDRVDAFLASTRKEVGRATALYRSAINNCTADEERSWVGYFYADHLVRRAFDLPAAISWAEKAHSSFNSHDSAHQLGNLYVRDHRFEEGKQLIESALERAPSPRLERIATTSLVDCLRRWSEAGLEDGLPPASLDRALRGIRLGIELHDSGSTDERLMQSILETAVVALKAARQTAGLGPEEERTLARTLQYLDGDRRFRVLSPWQYLEYAVFSLTVEVRSRLAPGFVATVSRGPAGTSGAAPEVASGERMYGSVTRLGTKYGFIAHPDFPNKVFFHAGSLRPPARIGDLEVGTLVEFTPSASDEGKYQAQDLILVERDVNPASAAYG